MQCLWQEIQGPRATAPHSPEHRVLSQTHQAPRSPPQEPDRVLPASRQLWAPELHVSFCRFSHLFSLFQTALRASTITSQPIFDLLQLQQRKASSEMAPLTNYTS